MVKMIQNHENKMELQMNRLEMRIEDMQEMFNRNLEKIKKSQLIMNNATSWEIDGETVKIVSDFILGGLQNHCRW